MVALVILKYKIIKDSHISLTTKRKLFETRISREIHISSEFGIHGAKAIPLPFTRGFLSTV